MALKIYKWQPWKTCVFNNVVFSLLLKLHQIEEVGRLPNWDSLFTQDTIFYQLLIGMNNMHGEGGKPVPWSLNQCTK